MTTPTSPTAGSNPAARSRGRTGTGGELYGLFLSILGTRGRIVGLGLLSLISVLVGVVFRAQLDPADQLESWTKFANTFGLSLVAPVVALMFASAALGGPAEDGTLVYLWLRPVSRLRLALAAYAASLTYVAPLVVIPLGVGALLSGAERGAVTGTVASATIAVMTYSGIFLWLGLRTRRSLAWGLAYILIWEGFVAMAGKSAARLAIRAYTRSLLADSSGVDLRLATITPAYAAIVPLVVAVVAVLLTARRLRTTEVT